MQVKNNKWSDEEFFQEREKVLAQWPTGKEFSLEEAIHFHQTLIPLKNAALSLQDAKERGDVLLQPRAGVALLEKQIELLRFLETEGGADILPTTCDSYTRANRYEEAQKGISESTPTGKSKLNGFPVVNYGVAQTRKIIEAISKPAILRLAAVDVRLAAEIGFAAGFTGFVNGPIGSAMHYSKNSTLEESIRNWQYVERLVGYYGERGVPIMREYFGIFSFAGVPPSLTMASLILECLLAAEQGVKFMGLNWDLTGNLYQDVAAVKVFPILCDEYLKRFGYPDITLISEPNQWNGAFPDDEARAYAVICWNTVTGVLGGGTEILVRSIEQGIGVPSKEANACALRATRQTVSMVKPLGVMKNREVDQEAYFIEAESRAILEKLFEMAEGDLIAGIVKAFQAGILEAPYTCSNRYRLGKVMVVRDNQGAARFLDFGNLPFSDEIREFHQSRIREREEAEGRKADYDMVVDSVLSISKGYLVCSSIRGGERSPGGRG